MSNGAFFPGAGPGETVETRLARIEEILKGMNMRLEERCGTRGEALDAMEKRLTGLETDAHTMRGAWKVLGAALFILPAIVSAFVSKWVK